MTVLAITSVCWLLAQAPSSTTPVPAGVNAEQAAVQAAQAARDAAQAARIAAEAAARATEAMGRLNGGATPPPPPAAATAPVGDKNGWVGTAGVALISLTGNATTLTFSANAGAERRWSDWMFGIKAFGLYGQTRPTATTVPPEVSALAGGVSIRGDRFLNKLLSIYLLGGADTDHVKSIEARGTGEGGVGLTWFENQAPEGYQKSYLRTDISLRYAKEYRFQYYPVPVNVPDVDILGPRVGVVFRYGLSPDILFVQELELISSLLGPSRMLANSNTKLASRLTQTLSLAVSFLVTYDSLPAVGKLTTDTALTVGLEAKI